MILILQVATCHLVHERDLLSYVGGGASLANMLSLLLNPSKQPLVSIAITLNRPLSGCITG